MGIGKKGGDLWRVWCQDWSCGIPPPQYPLSTIETIEAFFSSINDNPPEQLDLQLGRVLTQHCEFNDLVFYIPFQGKEVFSLHTLFIIISRTAMRKKMKKCVTCFVFVVTRSIFENNDMISGQTCLCRKSIGLGLV